MKMEQIECFETSAYQIETAGNYPKENIIYSEHGESLKSRILHCQLWPVWLYHIFPHYLINGTIFRGGGEFTIHKKIVF